MTNRETELAWKFISETSTSVFLTGKAGTGKTTFLRSLKESQPKRMAVVAPTGVAAINAQGMTIHSFFQLPLGPHVPGGNEHKAEGKYFRMSQDKKNILKTLDLLVMDEISMVRCDLLDFIDEVLRKYKDRYKPFGGVQLLMIGDLFQLAPVAKEDEWNLLRPYYETPYFFSSHALQQTGYVTIELTKIYRQTDSEFISLLGKVRENNLDASALRLLNTRFVPNFSTPSDEDWIRLTTHNRTANNYNQSKLDEIPAEPVTIKASVTGNFPETAYPADYELVLKKGAQVMFIRNDQSPLHAYYNGKIGVVTAFDGDKVTVISKEDGSEVQIGPATWENNRYELNPDTKEIVEVQDGTFTQYPLRLAWAITIHKSQGLTFDHAVIDFNDAFAHGQTYVALSRCRTLQGLVLTRPVNVSAIISDRDVNDYVMTEITKAKQTENQLPQMQFDYFVSMLTELFGFSRLKMDYDYLVRVVDEHLYNAQPEFLRLLKETRTMFEAEVLSVAEKFRIQYMSILSSSAGEYASNQYLQERIMNGSEYFTRKLLAAFTPVNDRHVFDIGNKSVKEQYNNAYDSFFLSLKVKIGTLSATVKHGFSVKDYLRDKANAVLFDIKEQKKQKPRGRKPKTIESEKTHRVDTKLLTLNLYRQGKTIKEIAEDRKFGVSTIENHLSYFVGHGVLDVDDFVSREKQVRIRRVIDSFDKAYSLSDVKTVLPDCTYHEIKCVKAIMDNE
ncbi:MAG: helix-turn-helix domain-containing protein [Bacteroidaceae bacterium]|nr:helix-turn-helix domain-containing protein [Bacteroidaceae bacterium]